MKNKKCKYIFVTGGVCGSAEMSFFCGNTSSSGIQIKTTSSTSIV